MKRREAEEEEKRIRAEEIAHKREMDRLLAESELHRKNALAAAEIEGKRLMLEAKIANQKAKQDASLLRGGGSRTVSHHVSGDTNGGAQGDTRQEGDADQDTKIRSVLTHLIDKGETGATDIAKTLGIGRKTVYRYLDRLTDEGLVRKVEKPGKPGQYTWEPVLPDIKHTDSAHVELSANGVAVH
jgi:DNA-binding transcriptional ArsR family regulator